MENYNILRQQAGKIAQAAQWRHVVALPNWVSDARGKVSGFLVPVPTELCLHIAALFPALEFEWPIL